MDWNLFRAEGLARALTDAGYDVSKRTVERWKSGEANPSKAQLDAIQRLVGAHAKAAPDVPERLDRIEGLLRAIAAVTPGVQLDEVEQVADELEQLGRQRGESHRTGSRGIRGESTA